MKIKFSNLIDSKTKKVIEREVPCDYDMERIRETARESANQIKKRSVG